MGVWVWSGVEAQEQKATKQGGNGLGEFIGPYVF